ncbi:hypothetical protein JD844_017330 [Phrynosoma platyrhinos]|uniref:Uncharacterized protein n=1 Tax=Phrynosoma platyrhinos TaxID=52577 RepID=A0ABQ7SLS8_PHRPL|nr:hypothetical protein JD844_017330 [Phrynosoma platyrhinos]
MQSSTRQSISGASGPVSDDVEVVQVKRKIFGNRIISVNFLVNDLYFYLEMEKFFHVADSVVVLASLGLYTEKDIAFLRSKVVTINKLFLNSDIPPKLRADSNKLKTRHIRVLSFKMPFFIPVQLWMDVLMQWPLFHGQVNLTEAQVGQIRNQIAEGQVNRTLYHGAILSIFPILLYFWKR